MGFLSSGSQGIGPHLKMRWRTWVSSQVAMGILGISRVAKTVSSLLPSCEGELVIALESLQGNQASSCIEGGIWCFLLSCGGKPGFLSTCSRDLREPLVLPQGSQASLRVARGNSGSLASHCRGIGWETRGSSPIVTEISGFLSSCNRGVRPCLMLNHGNPLSSLVVKGMSGLLSS